MCDSGDIRWSSARTMAKARCPPLTLSTAVHAPRCYEAQLNLLYFGSLRPIDIDLKQRRRGQLLS